MTSLEFLQIEEQPWLFTCSKKGAADNDNDFSTFNRVQSSVQASYTGAAYTITHRALRRTEGLPQTAKVALPSGEIVDDPLATVVTSMAP